MAFRRGPWGKEVLWRWARLDRQHLVVRQRHSYAGWVAARIDYVKLVPLSEPTRCGLEAAFAGPADKLVAGYWEPYSWAFHDNVEHTLWHRAQLSAFVEARVSLVDTQINRFGAKAVYETRLTDQLLGATIGDPIGHVARPTTSNVGKMQQFTNTLDATLRYASQLGLQAHANFGASNCYPGSPLQGEFSKGHPDWMRGSALRFEVPEVRQHALGLFREALEIGAPGVSIDFCRYPETIDTPATCNQFLAALRRLADEFGSARGCHVPILVRFPGTGVRRSALFDYRTVGPRGSGRLSLPEQHPRTPPAHRHGALRGGRAGRRVPLAAKRGWARLGTSHAGAIPVAGGPVLRSGGARDPRLSGRCPRAGHADRPTLHAAALLERGGQALVGR